MLTPDVPPAPLVTVTVPVNETTNIGLAYAPGLPVRTAYLQLVDDTYIISVEWSGDAAHRLRALAQDILALTAPEPAVLRAVPAQPAPELAALHLLPVRDDC